MKPISITLLVVVVLAACLQPAKPPLPTASPSMTAPVVTPTVDASVEETEVRTLVENFGKRLKSVSLLAPDAAQEIQTQYAEFVSPDLLAAWKSDPSKAPGRLTSSPWPDRIEISTLGKEGSDRYAMTGLVIEVTSVEAVNGGAFATQPVRMVVQKLQGGWLITEYTAKP